MPGVLQQGTKDSAATIAAEASAADTAVPPPTSGTEPATVQPQSALHVPVDSSDSSSVQSRTDAKDNFAHDSATAVSGTSASQTQPPHAAASDGMGPAGNPTVPDIPNLGPVHPPDAAALRQQALHPPITEDNRVTPSDELAGATLAESDPGEAGAAGGDTAGMSLQGSEKAFGPSITAAAREFFQQ